MKDLEFHGTSLADIRKFPALIVREIGYQLHRIQSGLEPRDWKPLVNSGKGFTEVRFKDSDGIYRVIYVANLSDKIHVLHAFKKKDKKTRKEDLEIAEERYKLLLRRK